MKRKRIKRHALLVCMIISTCLLTNNAHSQTVKYKIKKNNFIKKNGQYFSADSFDNPCDIADTTSFLVKFNSSVDSYEIDSFATKHNLLFKRTLQGNWYQFKTTNRNSLLFCDSVQNSQLIELIRVPVYYQALVTPNDPQYSNQWHLPRINASNAWNITTGNGTVIVAVLDNGVDWDHSDLGEGTGSNNYQNMYLNNAENDWLDPDDPNSGNNTDDDQNGYIDDWKWWNTSSEDNNTYHTSAATMHQHGTWCTGILAAKTNNSTGVAGVCGGWGNTGVKLMHVKIAEHNYTTDADIAEGIEYAVNNGAKVISISWGGTADLDDFIKDAVDYAELNEVGIVASSGNSNGPHMTVYYPAKHEYVIAVGNTKINDDINSTSCYDGPLDISAPGTNILTTATSNGYGSFSGTSASCPVVAGVVALMLSKNPCLTPYQIDYILKRTSSESTNLSINNYAEHPDVNPTGRGIRSFYNEEFGYMIIDAYRAVMIAEDLIEQSYDLSIRDHEDDDLYLIKEDFGQEPNPNLSSIPVWRSPDIWVRNQQDPNHQTPYHENPEYDPNNPVYVYVRIKNNGCQTSSGNDVLKLYWAKAAIALSWPNHWNGSMTNPTMGDIVGSVAITAIPAGEELILEIPWYVPNPNDYSGINPDPWHFCLLARIESAYDPMSVAEYYSVTHNTYNNNNIAWKNMEVVDLISNVGRRPGGAIAIGSIHNIESTYKLNFNCLQESLGNIFYEAEVTVTMDDRTWQKWIDGGQVGTGIDVIEEKVIQLLEQDASIENLSYTPYEYSTITVNFNFLTERVREYFAYDFNVIQYEQNTNELIGGEVYLVSNYDRTYFEGVASVTNPEIEEGSLTTVFAMDINEPAEYIWRNQFDSIIHIGKDNFTLQPNQDQMIVLEVTALNDGYKDYDTVYIKVKKEFIKQVSPNPATSQVNVKLKLDNSTSYILELVNSSQTTLQTHAVNGGTFNFLLNVNNLPPGVYMVRLLSNNGLLDSKQLIIN